MSSLANFKKKLRVGKVYRREELAKFSTAIDRHLAEAVADGSLQKLSQGLYYVPKMTAFGIAPPDEDQLIKVFLKGDDFLITSPNYYNALGLGTTQLYNAKRIYNHKRHEDVRLGNRVYQFRRKPKFPKKLTQEYLLVDFLNNLDALAEDKKAISDNLVTKIKDFDFKELRKNVDKYGSIAVKKLIDNLIQTL